MRSITAWALDRTWYEMITDFSSAISQPILAFLNTILISIGHDNVGYRAILLKSNTV